MTKEEIKEAANKWINGKGYTLEEVPNLLKDFGIYLRKEWLFEQEQESQLKPQEGESEKDEWELMDDLSKLSKDIYFPVQKFKP